MKKLILMFLAGCAVLCAFTACSKDDAEQEKIERLNSFLEINYSKIVLTVKDTFIEDLPLSDVNEELSLTSEYVITYTDENTVHVDYCVERFAQIDGILADENLATPEKIKGEAVIVDGAVASKTDDDAYIPPQIIGGGLDFKKIYFENINLGDMYFIADVKDPDSFMGTAITCSDMKVETSFLDAFYNILITYRSESGSKVEIRYAFTL